MNRVDIDKIRNYLADNHDFAIGKEVLPMAFSSDVLHARVMVIQEEEQETIWKYLIVLFEQVIADYWNGQKFVFRVWEFTKHGRTVKNLRDFFLKIKEII